MTHRDPEFHPAAIEEAAAAAAWYRERSLSAEQGFLAEIDRSAEQIVGRLSLGHRTYTGRADSSFAGSLTR
jgi:hypothetical protein